MSRNPVSFLAVRVIACLCGALMLAWGSVSGAATGEVVIEVLSNRADLISGGDALVEIVVPAGTDGAGLRMDVDGRDVTSAIQPRANGRLIGRVTGLSVGRNVVTARLADGRGARLTITNHPIGGPVFSGPQVQPWICSTQTMDLGPAQDAQCNVAPVYSYSYMPAGATGQCTLGGNACVGAFRPYDLANPPAAALIAQTTTDQGVTIPYIVRRERGVIDRGIYDIAVLFDPGKPWEPWAPQRGWNRKVVWVYGSGGEPAHRQISPPNVMDSEALSRGFAVATNAMVHNSQSFNDVVQAEAMMMTKERLIEAYGEVRYSIGTGCSGGSMSQNSIAANYPGLLDGIQPACSFADTWTVATEMTECWSLWRYFTQTSPHLWTEAQRAAATGYPSLETCNFMQGRSDSYTEPTLGSNCAGFDWTYNPQTNPTGERCTVQDYEVAIFGRRPEAEWGPIEQAIRRGFASRPYDTVGLQYGLNALADGSILAEQFVDLNEKIGGVDIDRRFQPQRSEADPVAVTIARRSGRFNQGRELGKVPFMELRGSSNAEEHYDWHSYLIRNRLIRDNGDAANMVYWRSPGPLAPDPLMAAESFLLIDRWLAAIEADKSADPVEIKVLRHKPAEAVDACWFGGQKVTDQAVCDAAIPYFRDPRHVAGAPPTGDVVKCQLKPLDRADYSFMLVPFTDAQWARLQAAFPTGVCDWTQPSVGQQPSIPWMTFAGGPGGQPLGDAPMSAPFDPPPPTGTFTLSPTVLWPPNHKLVAITQTLSVSEGATVSGPVVTSNEPQIGCGADDVAPDWLVSGASLQLRAERCVIGTGRVYTVTYTLANSAGKSAQVSATVSVPYNQ